MRLKTLLGALLGLFFALPLWARPLAEALFHKLHAPLTWVETEPLGSESWLEEIPRILKIEPVWDRRNALRSWIEFRHRVEASFLDLETLKGLLRKLPPATQTSLVLLNLHWIQDDAQALAELEAEFFSEGTLSGYAESLAEVGLAPESMSFLPDLHDLEDKFEFSRQDLRPLAQSALKAFLEGRIQPRLLAHYMGMQNSRHGELGRKIGAYVLANDPTYRGLEARCGFREAELHVQARIIYVKYIYGMVRRDTFWNWFRMQNDPELRECLTQAVGDPKESTSSSSVGSSTP